ncbi:MAG: tryptophan-rich sensory protein [Flavobacteriaceae bacterium]|nr:tryptophan-rich sensory protein [Flavobacteriaceae bacterium]
MKGFLKYRGKLNIKTLLISVAVCLVFALIEGLLAGGVDVYAFFENLNQPSFSLPVWVWFLAGGFYYIMCIAMLYNVFIAQVSTKRNISLVLLLSMMVTNTFWNILFFRLNELHYSFIGLLIFILIVLVLFVSLWKFQKKTAWILLPYLVWLVYDFFWMWDIWKLNI